MSTLQMRVWVAARVFCAALSGALGQANIPGAGSGRPAKVPDGYVITPFGYFHPSCVQSLARGERLLPDGRVQHADGTANGSVAVCNYPRYTPAGEAVSNTSPEVTGWIENASITTGSATTSYGALIALWTVPPQPTQNDGQTLFFFPGFEDTNNTQSILQPVLHWYGGQWDIASWNCCLDNITTESPVVKVSPGDGIYGSITSTCPRTRFPAPPGTFSVSICLPARAPHWSARRVTGRRSIGLSVA